jgi:hypothetical protein
MTEKFRITSDGNIGIGTTTPSSKLHISNTAAATRITITDDVSNGRSGYIESNYSDALVIGTTSGVRSIRFAPDNSTAMTIAVSACIFISFIGYQVGTLVAVCATAASLSFAGQLLKINADTTIQRTIDDAHRGRVFSIFDMMINISLILGITSYALIEGIRENINVGSAYTVVLLSCSAGLALFLLGKYRAKSTSL